MTVSTLNDAVFSETLIGEIYHQLLCDCRLGHWPSDITGLMENISNGVSTVVTDGGAPGSIGGGVFPFVGLINKSDETGTTPKAYLNYIVLDRRDTLVDFGYIRVTADAQESGANEPHEYLFKNDIVIRHPGYIYIYLSNENETPVEVFFDDFTVDHVKSPVIQTSDYYPYGLTFNSYQRENAVPNDLKFNGQEEQNELGLGWLDFGARMYLADMGRWSGVDPLAEKAMDWTPYRYGFNNPVKFTDPTGMFEYSNGYSSIDTRSESGSISFSGSYQGNEGDLKRGSTASRTVIATIDYGPLQNGLNSKGNGSSLDSDEQKMEFPTHKLSVLHSALDDFGWDWFKETTQYSSHYFIQTAVLIIYNTNEKDWGGYKFGKEVERITKTRELIMDAGASVPVGRYLLHLRT